jgi:ribonucleoside-diphosphate reductase alpha chain
MTQSQVIDNYSSANFKDTNNLNLYKVVRRNGEAAAFEPVKISVAMAKAFLAVEGSQGQVSARIRDLVSKLTSQVVATIKRRHPGGCTIHIEDIQDHVELALMRAGEHEVARAYILYREARAKERAAAQDKIEEPVLPSLEVTLLNGTRERLDYAELRSIIEMAAKGLKDVKAGEIFDSTVKALYDGVSEEELIRATILSARSLIEKDPSYTYATSRLLLYKIRYEVIGEKVDHEEMGRVYQEYFVDYVKRGISAELLDPRLMEFDLKTIATALVPDRDLLFQYLGLQTLYDRYLLKDSDQCIELPQAFWMRVSMGLSLNEEQKEDRAIEFYNLLSTFDFVSSTPTLFNSGTRRPQLSSCYLTTISDDLASIYDSFKENALLSKFAGGLGNDWSNVRALGSYIKGTNGKSQGVVPFLKVANDSAVAVNQGGRRKGAVCAYLETWHLDIEEFLECRKNTGDDRRRTHDMNTANWVPDLFMERVMQEGDWTLFSPSDVPELHDLYGTAFKRVYEKYEAFTRSGEIKHFKRVSAVQLWRKMLTMLFETGHPWITFKDSCNLRSPQQHTGVVHSSNLCTEITLNTSESEIAVCNLGSVNLVTHLNNNQLDLEKLGRTCRTAMRMLDNVIDINYYSVEKAKNSNLRHRPVGLGVMGFSDCLLRMKVPYASEIAVEFADYAQEAVSYFAILASSELAKERGVYESYKGSLWDRGILPQDSIELVAKERGREVEVDHSSKLDWQTVRESIKEYGMRNSNCLAIAPTATISNIAGVSQSIEPIYQNLYVKSNLSGDFTVLNNYLVEDLKARGLWDDVMVHDLKYFDGSLKEIDRVPADLKTLYATAFEIDPRWLVEAAARRQKWIDQAQSLNLYMSEPNGKKLDSIYKLAWIKGLKTTYYLRSLGATSAEKSTVKSEALNAVSTSQVCDLSSTECEACQ